MELQCRMDVINLYQCDPGFCTGKRVFPYHYLLYVHNGKGRYRIGNRVYPANRGDLFYCPPQEIDDIMADDADPFLLSGIEFVCNDGEFLRQNLSPASNLLEDSFCISAIREMIQEYSYGITGSQEVCNHLLTVLLLRVTRLVQKGTAGKQTVVSAILDYIRENLNREVTHAELSREFSYHKNSINRMLTEATGMTLKNYQIDLRIKKASALLAYSDKSIQEIADLCGYRNPAFFSRQYKQKTGVSPFIFRKEGKNYFHSTKIETIE